MLRLVWRNLEGGVVSRSLRNTIARSARLLIPAMLIAATGIVGGGAIGALGTACAAPKYDADFYGVCVEQKQRLYEKGKLTKQQRDAAFKECCELAGGKATFDNLVNGYICSSQADAPQLQPGDIPIQTFAPPLPPARVPGAINPTVTLAPAP
jgi:hypothetical protein